MKKMFLIFLLSSILIPADLMGQESDLTKAKKLFTDHNLKESQKILEKIISHDSKNAEANFLLSKIYFANGDIDNAEECAETSVEYGDRNAEYHYWLGACYGRDAQSASIFRKPFLASKTKNEFLRAVELNPKHIKARAGLAQFYLFAPGIMGGDIEKAREQANILLTLDEIQGRTLLININLKEKKYEETENEFNILEKMIGKDPEHYSFYNEYGYFLLNRGKTDLAIEKFREQVRLAPGKANPHDSLGEGLLKKGLYKESLIEYEKALQIDGSLENAKEKIKDIKEKLNKGS